jgi:lipoyl-dependent peroxiredoxin
MATRKAKAVWNGDLKAGHGAIALGEHGLEMQYSFDSRFKDNAAGTNPEELLGGAHAGCFSMALAHALEEAGHPPTHIETSARVQLIKKGDEFAIPKVELETAVDAAGINESELTRIANTAKENCPVSKLFKGAEITLQAHLLSVQNR